MNILEKNIFYSIFIIIVTCSSLQLFGGENYSSKNKNPQTPLSRFYKVTGCHVPTTGDMRRLPKRGLRRLFPVVFFVGAVGTVYTVYTDFNTPRTEAKQ